jgi:hypothetical protein
MQTALFIGMVNSVVVFIVACLLAFLLWRTNGKLERLLAVVALVVAMLTCWGLSASVIRPLIDEMTTAQPLALPSGLTDTPTATPAGPTHPSPTLAPTPILPSVLLYPAPGLLGPADGSEFEGDETILLTWDTPTPLSEDEWYEVQLWREGDVPYTVVQRIREGAWKVEPKYYPGRYQWRIRVVRGQEGKKERDSSPPSQTWSFSWLSPSVPVSTVPTSPPVGGTPDLTIYLRGTNNAEGFVVLRGDEHVDAGVIYAEGGYVYGNVAVRIGDTVYHFDPDPEPGEPEQLPAPYRLEVQFSDTLVAATDGKPGFDPQKAQFWVGTLDCNSATPLDKPYTIEMALSAGGEIQRRAEVSFLVADDPLCDGPPETGRIWQPPPTYTPTPLYSPTPKPTPSYDFTVYLRGTNNAEAFVAFDGEHVDAGRIYTEGGYVYGEIAVRIRSREYHYYEQGVRPPPRHDDLYPPFRVEFKFSDSLLAATKGVQPQFDESNLRFWAGVLDCNSATDESYKIEATLYDKEGKIRKHTEINFLVVDDPLCDGSP